MGVAGGAVLTPIQGAVADHASTRISMVVPLVGFVVVFTYVAFHWFTHGKNILRVKDIVVAADTAGRRGSAWGGAVGGAVNYVHYTGEKEGMTIAVQVKRPSVSHGETVLEEQKGNPILL